MVSSRYTVHLTTLQYKREDSFVFEQTSQSATRAVQAAVQAAGQTMAQTVIKGLMAALIGLAVAFHAGAAAAHGKESLEEDSCVRRIGENMVHLSAYQPQYDATAQYCTEIPKGGDTYLVV